MTATPLIFDKLYPKRLWRKNAEKKIIYLTFDDGPIENISPWVLETLEKYKAKASFFVVGENVKNQPGIVKEIIEAGHTIGNHTYNHLNGWKTDTKEYLENVRKGQIIIEDTLGKPVRLFRPPYGRLKQAQANVILKDHEIVMWSVLTKDYKQNINPETCLNNSIKATENGSIVLFHDSIKAVNTLKTVLPRYLDYFAEKGFRFSAL